MRIMVIDGQGGGVGKIIVEGLRRRLPDEEIIAVGTNAAATSNMLRGGATVGATGENAVKWNVARADVIVGPVGVYFANAMAGEITPCMAEALAGSPAEKVAVPVSRCHIHIVGVQEQPLTRYVEQAVDVVCRLCRKGGEPG